MGDINEKESHPSALYALRTDAVFGRYFVAARDIKAGELILEAQMYGYGWVRFELCAVFGCSLVVLVLIRFLWCTFGSLLVL
jgi:hypothetical protein